MLATPAEAFPESLKLEAASAAVVHIANTFLAGYSNPEEHVESFDQSVQATALNWDGRPSLLVRIQHDDNDASDFEVQVISDDVAVIRAYVTPGDSTTYAVAELSAATSSEVRTLAHALHVARVAVRLLLSSCDAQLDRPVPTLDVAALPASTNETPEQQYERLLKSADELEGDAEDHRGEAEDLQDRADDLDREASAMRKQAEDLDAQHQITSPESDLEVGMMVWIDRVRRTVIEIGDPIIWPEHDPRRRDGSIPPKPRWRCLEDDCWHPREDIEEIIANVRNTTVTA